MTLTDPIADSLVHIKNSDKASKTDCVIRPASSLMGEILKVFQKQGYVKAFELVEDGREGIYRVGLAGHINDCKAIKPRYAVKKNGYEKFEQRYLPAKDIGVIVVSTPDGVMTHRDAKQKGVGGRLLAYVY